VLYLRNHRVAGVDRPFDELQVGQGVVAISEERHDLGRVVSVGEDFQKCNVADEVEALEKV
jgi:hypothetical protein